MWAKFEILYKILTLNLIILINFWKKIRPFSVLRICLFYCFGPVNPGMWVCVCVWERDREWESERKREWEWAACFKHIHSKKKFSHYERGKLMNVF